MSTKRMDSFPKYIRPAGKLSKRILRAVQIILEPITQRVTAPKVLRMRGRDQQFPSLMRANAVPEGKQEIFRQVTTQRATSGGSDVTGEELLHGGQAIMGSKPESKRRIRGTLNFKTLVHNSLAGLVRDGISWDHNDAEEKCPVEPIIQVGALSLRGSEGLVGN